MSALEIALLSNKFLPHRGGTQVYYYNLFRRIATMGDTVRILTTLLPGWQDFDAGHSVDGFEIKRHFTPLRDLSYSQLPKLFEQLPVNVFECVRNRPDVLHCGNLYPAGVIAVFLKRFFRIPFVAYCHGEDVTLTERFRFQPRMRNLVYSNADAIIANGEFAISNLKQIGISPSKIHKITPGVDCEAFTPQQKDPTLLQRYNLSRDDTVIMTVSRLAERKGHKLVLKALHTLREAVPSARYVIVGCGPCEGELRQMVRDLDLEDHVVFAGFVPDQDLNAHYNLADIVAMPNTGRDGDFEGFGMVFIEANATGKPVIGGTSGGTREAVVDGQSGYLVDTSDANDLTDAVYRLLINPQLRKQLGDWGLERSRREFTWDSRAEKVRAISRAVRRPEAFAGAV
jgi:phosphatidyl-myo-inositol dimannoside synthase